MKRFLSILLALVLTLGLLPAQAAPLMTGESAQSVETPQGEEAAPAAPPEERPETPPAEPDAGEELPAELSATGEWITVPGIEGGRLRFDSSTGTITDCGYAVTAANIPSIINGVAVTTIGYEAFRDCSSLTRITIPESFTSIRISGYAFADCPNLTSVTIPQCVTYIDRGAFSGCSSLTSVTILGNSTGIGYRTFEGCSRLTSAGPIGSGCSIEFGWTEKIPSGAFSVCSSLTSITFPKGVTSIGGSAFAGCYRLTDVTIPEGVTSIGGYAFSDCSGLTSITIPEGVTSIDDYAFEDCTGLTSVAILEGVASIGSYAFHGCSNLISVTIPKSVTSIGDHAFWGCSSLTSITIPESVTSIGYGTFDDCSSLTSVTIPESVTSIEDYAFAGCSSLANVTIPEHVTYIGDSAFRYCSNLTSVTIPGSVTSIGGSAFAGCSSLTSVTILEGVTDIGGSAFEGCSGLTSVTIPEGVTSIGSYAFRDCSSLTSVTILEGVTSIGSYAFEDCTGLTSVTIPEGVTSIGGYAFRDCSGLTSVTVPASLTSVSSFAFYYCTSLERIVYNGTAAQLAKISSDGKLDGIPVYCAMTELAVSFDANGGSGSMENIILVNIDTHVSTLPDCAFTPPSLMQFKAWEVNGKEYQPGDPVTLEAGATITALWKNCVHDGAKTVIEEEVLTPGDCGNDGRKRVQSLCNICGQSVTEEVVIPATGAHTLGDTVTVKAPAGAVAGQGRKDCSVCGYKETFPLFEVRYRALNCAPSMPNVIYEGETKISLPRCTLTPPEGYSFSCWEVGGEQHAPGYIYTVAANTVITPVWELESVRFPITARATPTSVTVYTNQPMSCEIGAGYIPTRFTLLDADEQVLVDKSFSSWLATSTLDDLLPTEPGTYTIRYELSVYTQTTVAGQVVKQPTGQSEAYSRTLDLRAPGTPLSCDIQPDGSLRFGLGARRFSESGTAALATYSAGGAMLDVCTVAMSDMTEGCSKTAALKLEEGGTYKLFLLDGQTGAPLLDALVGDTVVPKSQEEIIFELLRDYAKTGSYSSEFYQKAFTAGTRNAVILYHPPLDAAYIAYRDGDSAEVFLPFTKDGAQPGCRYSKRFLNASEPLTAIFEIDPATFDGKSIPAVHQYTSEKPSGFGTMQETQFAEDCRHGMTQLLVVLQAFLSQRDHSIEELGFSAFDPELFPSQNAAFNKLVLYATAKGGYSNTKVIESASGTVYTAKYVPSEQKVVLSIVFPSASGSMTSPTADTRLTLYADMRTPYEVSMKFFRYSGLASASIDPASYTKSSTIRLDPPNASNYDWATECRDWVNSILDWTTTLALFDLSSDAMLLDYYSLDDLGFTSYES